MHLKGHERHSRGAAKNLDVGASHPNLEFPRGPWSTLINAADTVTGKADIIGLIRWSHWVNIPAEATGGISRSKYLVESAVFATYQLECLVY